MSLRDRLIEAGAHAQVSDFNALSEGAQVFYSEISEHVLDAFLDTLAENADEWITTAGGHPENGIDRRATAALIVVLRGDE